MEHKEESQAAAHGQISSDSRNLKSSSTTSPAAHKLEALPFDNLALRALPVDTSLVKRTRTVPNACFSLIDPTPLETPQVVSVSPSALRLLGLSEEELKRPEFAEYLSGNNILPGARPAAHCYCGHQFGYFSGQLGDGATMYLGEVLNPSIQPSGRVELQFKGAGITPFSRQADGRKVLRSSIREYLCSELMAALGVPTTRAGTCVTSDSKVVRDMFYTGNNVMERATVITRMAQSFIRFGSFEIFKPTDEHTGRAGPSVGRNDILQQLLDYVVDTFYPHITSAHSDKRQRYAAFFEEVTRRTAYLIATWQCVGWEHGVMNTDNMSILGVTIDYGPYGFLDRYDPDFISNTSDDNGRYTYRKQPEIAKWNLQKLAEALEPLLPKSLSEPIVERWEELYEHEYYSQMKLKLGLVKKNSDQSVSFAARAAREAERSASSGLTTVGAETADEEDRTVTEALLKTMYETGADFTNTFRALSMVKIDADSASSSSSSSASLDRSSIVSANTAFLNYVLDQCSSLSRLLSSYSPRIPPQQLQMLVMLSQREPALLEQLGGSPTVIAEEFARAKKRKELQQMTEEEKRAENRKEWEEWLVQYVERLTRVRRQAVEEGAVESAAVWSANRVALQNASNAKFVLRNWIAQVAIEKAEAGDYSEVNRVLLLLSDPYVQHSDIQQKIAEAFPRTSCGDVANDSGVGSGTGPITELPSSATNSGATCSIVRARDDRVKHRYTVDEYAAVPPDWSTQVKVSCSS